MDKADRLKALLMCYWRFEKKCPMVANEACDADVMAINPSGMIIETEVKLSIADLRRDKLKFKHRRFIDLYALPECHYFYFATPPELQEKALSIISEVYPYAGYLVVHGENVIDFWGRDITLTSPNVEVIKKARRIERAKMEKTEFLRLVKAQSGKLCRLMLDANRATEGK